MLFLNGTREVMQKPLAQFDAYPGEVMTFVETFRNSTQLKTPINEVRAFGRIDVLVNNAGITRDEFINAYEQINDFDDVMKINLKGY